MKQSSSNVQLPSDYYNAGLSARRVFETKAIQIAEISIPYVIRKDGSNSSTRTNRTVAQSFNAGIIHNLKAKMGMSLLPPSTSSFRLRPDPKQLAELVGNNESAIAKINNLLSINYEAINSEIENQQIRDSLFDLILQLIVVGSCVVQKLPKNGIQIHPLKTFVASLDSRGQAYKICVKEVVHELPDGITPKEEKEEYDLYTMLEYDTKIKMWISSQEIEGIIVNDGIKYKPNVVPFKYYGWTWNVGDDYHRPFAEDYLADMEQVNSMATLNTTGALIAAKSVIMVNPRGNRTRKDDIANAGNGDVIDGSAEDVTSFQLQKSNDFNISNSREQTIMRGLQKAFLDSGSIQRDAERVTAQEIQYMAQQLESSTLSGVYSKMSKQWSKWIIEVIMDELKLKFDSIEVQVLTGLDALGRGQQAQSLDNFVQRLGALGLNQWINSSELINRYASFEGILTQNLVKTPEQVQQEQQQAQQQAQQQQMMESGAQSLGQEGAKAAIQNLTGQGN